jgi:hypothetical protein
MSKKRLHEARENKPMEYTTQDFFMYRDTAKAARMSNRLDNLFDELDRCTDSHCKASQRVRQENFLLGEADKILLDTSATRSAKAFAGIVYEIVSGFQEEISKDNDEW